MDYINKIAKLLTEDPDIILEYEEEPWVPEGYGPLPHSWACQCWGCLHESGQCGQTLCKHPDCIAANEDDEEDYDYDDHDPYTCEHPACEQDRHARWRDNERQREAEMLSEPEFQGLPEVSAEDDEASPDYGCPDPVQLNALALGELPPDQAHPLALHVDQCTDCRAMLGIGRFAPASFAAPRLKAAAEAQKERDAKKERERLEYEAQQRERLRDPGVERFKRLDLDWPPKKRPKPKPGDVCEDCLQDPCDCPGVRRFRNLDLEAKMKDLSFEKKLLNELYKGFAPLLKYK